MVECERSGQSALSSRGTGPPLASALEVGRRERRREPRAEANPKMLPPCDKSTTQPTNNQQPTNQPTNQSVISPYRTRTRPLPALFSTFQNPPHEALVPPTLAPSSLVP